MKKLIHRKFEGESLLPFQLLARAKDQLYKVDQAFIDTLIKNDWLSIVETLEDDGTYHHLYAVDEMMHLLRYLDSSKHKVVNP